MIKLFSNISDRNKTKLLRILEASTLNFKRDSQILQNVKWENVVCMVESGYAMIIRVDYNGNQVIIEELRENSVFGTKLSSINSSEYEIIAKEDTSLIVIEYSNILTLLDKPTTYSNQFIKNILAIFSDTIQKQSERIEVLTRKSIRDKLLAFFELISKKQFSKNIIIPFTLGDLADHLSIDRSAMMREIKSLKDEGIIQGKGQKIKLLY